MRTVIQRVSEASVTIDGNIYSEIGAGILILLGIEDDDSEEDITWLCNKLTNLRIFNDEQRVMNKSIMEISGEFLVVSQFTLHASTKKGNRPSYIRASKPSTAIPLYEKFIVKTGVFGADMKVGLINDGPVTILMDTKNKE